MDHSSWGVVCIDMYNLEDDKSRGWFMEGKSECIVGREEAPRERSLEALKTIIQFGFWRLPSPISMASSITRPPYSPSFILLFLAALATMHTLAGPFFFFVILQVLLFNLFGQSTLLYPSITIQGLVH